MSPGMYNHYTDNGMRQMYFVLKKGFKTISRGSPEYADSMLAVIVMPNGSLDPQWGCTSRLNDGGGHLDEVGI